MVRIQGRLPTAEASRFMMRLCFHFSRKIQVAYDEHQGRAEFPSGQCLMRAASDALDFECRADDSERLDRIRATIDEHVELFSRKAPMQVAWAASGVVPDTVG